MTEDIVTRLRDVIVGSIATWDLELRFEAAAEIERLRVELALADRQASLDAQYAEVLARKALRP